MDTSETYIKMCEKAEEIQELRGKPTNIDESIEPWQDGDFFCVHPDPRWPDEGDEIDIAFECRDGYYARPQCEAIWLPRQDQLQEMVDWKGLDSPCNIVKRFYEWACDTISVDYSLYFTSMEQLWLAFVMKEKYNKVWNGEEWVKVE